MDEEDVLPKRRKGSIMGASCSGRSLSCLDTCAHAAPATMLDRRCQQRMPFLVKYYVSHDLTGRGGRFSCGGAQGVSLKEGDGAGQHQMAASRQQQLCGGHPIHEMTLLLRSWTASGQPVRKLWSAQVNVLLDGERRGPPQK